MEENLQSDQKTRATTSNGITNASFTKSRESLDFGVKTKSAYNWKVYSWGQKILLKNNWLQTQTLQTRHTRVVIAVQVECYVKPSVWSLNESQHCDALPTILQYPSYIRCRPVVGNSAQMRGLSTPCGLGLVSSRCSGMSPCSPPERRLGAWGWALVTDVSSQMLKSDVKSHIEALDGDSCSRASNLAVFMQWRNIVSKPDLVN